jgi:hypothetical protein
MTLSGATQVWGESATLSLDSRFLFHVASFAHAAERWSIESGLVSSREGATAEGGGVYGQAGGNLAAHLRKSGLCEQVDRTDRYIRRLHQ